MKKGLQSIISLMALACTLLVMLPVNAKAAELKVPDAAVLEISDYTIEEGGLNAGGTVTLDLTITNASENNSASSAVLTMTSTSGMIYPVYGEDNQIYIGNLEPGASTEVSVQLSVSREFNADAVDLECEFSYVTLETLATNQVTLAIPTSAGNSLNISSVKVAENATIGGQSLVNLNYSNTSGSDITDAKLIVEGNVSESTQEIDLGNVSSGKSYLKDYYVSFTQAGDQEISLTLEYTDSKGESYSVEEGTYTVHVTTAEETANITTSGTSFMKIIGLAVTGVIAIILLLIVISYIKKHI